MSLGIRQHMKIISSTLPPPSIFQYIGEKMQSKNRRLYFALSRVVLLTIPVVYFLLREVSMEIPESHGANGINNSLSGSISVR